MSPFLPFSLCLLTFFHSLTISPASSFYPCYLQQPLLLLCFLTHKGFFVSCIFLADMDTSPFIRPLPTPPLQSLHLHPPFPTVLMYWSQQIKQNPPINTSLSNQLNCSRTLCLRGTFFLAGKHYLMASNQPLRACCCLIIKKWVFLLEVCLPAKFWLNKGICRFCQQGLLNIIHYRLVIICFNQSFNTNIQKWKSLKFWNIIDDRMRVK